MLFRVARHDERDATAFCDLYNSFYRRQVGPAYYSWQFFLAPFPCRLCLVVDPEDRLLGTYGLQLRPSRSAPPTAWSIDIMIRPEVQDLGIFRRLAGFAGQVLRELSPVAWLVMGNSAGADAHLHGLGWRKLRELADWVAPVRPGPQEGRTFCYRRVESFEGLEGLIPDPALNTVRRDRAHLEWRFTSHPLYAYEQFVVHGGGTLRGYMALKVFTDPVSGEQNGDVVDLVCSGEEEELLTDMLRFSFDHFRSLGATTISLWPESSPALTAAARRLGFVPSQRRRLFCGTVLDPAYEQLIDFHSWWITMADTELY